METIEHGEYDFRVEVLTKLARLETLMTDLAGNGRPGRMGRIESCVSRLQNERSRDKGIVIGISTLISALAALAFYLSQIIFR